MCFHTSSFLNRSFIGFSSVQLLSCVWPFVTPWIAAHQASLSITSSRSSLRLTSSESVMPSSYLILCHPLLLLPPIPPSIRVFSNESTLRMRWPEYWSFSFSIIPSKEHPGLISFRMDWLDLLTVQGTLKSLFQHHTSKASILRHSAFFTVQLSLHWVILYFKLLYTLNRVNFQCNIDMAALESEVGVENTALILISLSLRQLHTLQVSVCWGRK